MRRLILFFLVLAMSGIAFSQWKLQKTGLQSEFRGLDVVNEKVAWASGSRNTYARTTDGGETWEVATVPDKESLDFRDVAAFDADTTFLLSIGTGTKSRIYKTTDGGKIWTAQLINPHPKAFLDAFAFWDVRNGVAVSDPVDGRFLIMRTTDGGAHWTAIPEESIPPALSGEGVFAASGTTITISGKGNAWFATGGAAAARVFRSADKGLTWSVADTPIIAGQASSGIFSVAFKDARNGIIVGGDYRKVEEAKNNIARTTDGGRTWTLITDSRLGGFRSCVAYLPGTRGTALVAVGPSGTDYSEDGGGHWAKYDSEGFHVLAFAKSKAVGWAAGAGGRIAKFMPLPSKQKLRSFQPSNLFWILDADIGLESGLPY
ncbi:MAG: glycosyl hydrolase [Acidobacteriia bacterium]|nr:glycosyl hydrolase [Terriglobia bacterium]